MSDRISLTELSDALWAEDGSPGWTEDAMWRGTITAARAKVGCAAGKFMEAFAWSLRPRFLRPVRDALLTRATEITAGWMYPPGVNSVKEYVEYLEELKRWEGT